MFDPGYRVGLKLVQCWAPVSKKTISFRPLVRRSKVKATESRNTQMGVVSSK